MCPFQCDLCHFCNIQNQDLNLIDAFWSRESSTVWENVRSAKRLEEIGDSLGILGWLHLQVCTQEMLATFGMALAASLLIQSLDQGKTEEDTIQFSTAWYLRSIYPKIYHTLPAELQTGLAMMVQGTHKIQVTNCPIYSYWFERFMRRVHKRMDEEV
jgi:hypothetical protein